MSFSQPQTHCPRNGRVVAKKRRSFRTRLLSGQNMENHIPFPPLWTSCVTIHSHPIAPFPKKRTFGVMVSTAIRPDASMLLSSSLTSKIVSRQSFKQAPASKSYQIRVESFPRLLASTSVCTVSSFLLLCPSWFRSHTNDDSCGLFPLDGQRDFV
jgi:hypothetical protein